MLWNLYGDVAQMGEHLVCTQKVRGSIPLISRFFDIKFKVYE